MGILSSIFKTKSVTKDSNCSVMTSGSKTAVMQTLSDDNKKVCIITTLKPKQARQLQKEYQRWSEED